MISVSGYCKIVLTTQVLQTSLVQKGWYLILCRGLKCTVCAMWCLILYLYCQNAFSVGNSIQRWIPSNMRGEKQLVIQIGYSLIYKSERITMHTVFLPVPTHSFLSSQEVFSTLKYSLTIKINWKCTRIINFWSFTVCPSLNNTGYKILFVLQFLGSLPCSMYRNQQYVQQGLSWL